MTTQHNKQTAAEFFARFSAGDIPGAVDLLSTDATWWIAGTPGLFPPAGRYTKEEIATLFTRMTRRLKDGLSMTVKNAIAEGDLVALEVESHGELTNGRIYHNQYHTLMRVLARQIHEVREYSDTQHAHSIWLEPEPRRSSLSHSSRARRAAVKNHRSAVMTASMRNPLPPDARSCRRPGEAVRGRHTQVAIDRPHVLSRSGVPEPEFDVEYEVLAAGTVGGPQPLIVGCPGRGGQGGQVVIDGLLAGARGAGRQVRGVRVLPLPHRLSLACPGPAASGGALLCRGWPPGMLSRTRRTGLPAKPDWYPREGAAGAGGGWAGTAGSPDLYDAGVRAAGPAGTVAAWAPGTFYRGTALTFRRGARYTSRLACRPVRAGWGRRMARAGRSRELEWYRFAHRATPRQLALFGFPPPGHPYRTEATLDGTARRYPG